MKRKIVMLSVAIAMIFGLTASQTQAAQVYGILSNFDLYNLTGQDVNDLDLTLTGLGLTCDRISNYYCGWGTVGGVPSGGCQDLGGGRIRITWSDPTQPIPPGQFKHFGVRFKAGAPDVTAEEAIWTFNGVQVDRIAFISQAWLGTLLCPVADILWPPDSLPVVFGPPWRIERSWAWTSTIIPLNSLTQDNPLVTGLSWSTPLIETMTGDPNIGLELWTDPLPQQGAVVVKYSVMSGANLLAVFTNEAELEEAAQIPTLSEWGMIIFVVLLAGWMTFVVVRRWRARATAA
jgi:hypothetical protein